MADPQLIRDTVLEWLDTRDGLPARWPRLRHGPRPLPDPDTRRALFSDVCSHEHERTGRRTCRYCGTTRTPLQLDHLIPWSAHGCDHPHNLRLACPDCNEARSNWASYPVTYRDEHDMAAAMDCAMRQHPAVIDFIQTNANLFGHLTHDQDYWYPEQEDPP